MAKPERFHNFAAPPAETQNLFGDDLRARAFAQFLGRHKGERHIAALQDFPDPDAISSAMAYRALADKFDIDVDIVYEGRISHQENMALVQSLDIELTRFTEGLPLDRMKAVSPHRNLADAGSGRRVLQGGLPLH